MQQRLSQGCCNSSPSWTRSVFPERQSVRDEDGDIPTDGQNPLSGECSCYECFPFVLPSRNTFLEIKKLNVNTVVIADSFQDYRFTYPNVSLVVNVI